MVIHGGFDGIKCLCDTAVLDTSNMSWTALRLEEGCTPLSRPGPRALHSLSIFEHGLWIFGGASNNTILHSAYLIYNAAVRSGMQVAAMLVAAQGQTALLQDAVITAGMEASILKEALQTLKQEYQVSPDLAFHIKYPVGVV